MAFMLDGSNSDVALQGRISRRSLLGIAGMLGVGAPFALAGGARAVTVFGVSPSASFVDGPICRTAATAESAGGPPRRLTLAWNATSICTTAAPVAKERGIFARHNLDVDFINYGGSTEQLLEAIATGKADAGIGMALRWLKPLEQVSITCEKKGYVGSLRSIEAASRDMDGTGQPIVMGKRKPNDDLGLGIPIEDDKGAASVFVLGPPSNTWISSN